MSSPIAKTADIVPIDAPAVGTNNSSTTGIVNSEKGIKRGRKPRSKPNAAMADNFPAKTHLLITHLTETDPDVSEFSADGASFHVYDQATFSQKYLPQYFKHSNWGSFVRQLNLYGFTSSRLKENSDVVVWTHDLFHRDKKELLIEIKRTKKNKNASSKSSPATFVHRAASPSSSEGGSSSHSEGRINSSLELISGQNYGTDHEWLQSQFTYLRKQNMYLEQKLDTLLKLTLRLSPVTLEEVQAGEKRRRVSQPELKSPGAAAAHANNDNLKPIHEEEKIPEGNDSGGKRRSSREDRAISYDAAEEKSHGKHLEAKDDSFKAFIDVMLTKEDSESKEMEEFDSENCFDDDHPSSTFFDQDTRVKNELDSAFVDDSSFHSPEISDEDELMTEAMGAMLPDVGANTNETFFGLDPEDEPAEDQERTQWVTTTNLNVDKVSGPQPVHVVSSDITQARHDVEEGNMPVGVAVVSAHVVDTENIDTEALQRQVEQERNDRRQKRLMIYFIAFIGVAVLATLAALLGTEASDQEDSATASSGAGNDELNDDQLSKAIGSSSSDEPSLVRASWPQSNFNSIEKTRDNSLISKDISPSFESFSLSIEGEAFYCSSRNVLF